MANILSLLKEAKARFSELVRKASLEGPQEVTVGGKPGVIIMAKKEYDQLVKKKKSFVELMNTSPLKGTRLSLKRNRSKGREIDL